MRVQFTPEQRLQLSGDFLTHLRGWAEVAAEKAKEAKENEPAYKKPAESDEKDGNSETEEMEKEEEEDGEVKLARTLVEDFGAAGEVAVNDQESSSGGFSDYYLGLLAFTEKFMAIPTRLEAEDHVALVDRLEAAATVSEGTSLSGEDQKAVPVNPAPPAVSRTQQGLSSISAQQLKDMGNEKFFASKFFLALGFYTIGIKKLLADKSNPSSSASDNTTQATSLLASLHYNCASCYWKLAATAPAPEQHAKLLSQCASSEVLKKYVSSEYLHSICEVMEINSSSKESLLAVCMEHCVSCLAVFPSHRRALHRQASCLHAQEKYQDALSVIEQGLARVPSTTTLTSMTKQSKQDTEKTVEETNALHDLRRLCVANMLIVERAASVERASAGGEAVEGQSSGGSHLVNNQVSSILGKLKARQVREEQRSSHAWDGVERTWEGDEGAGAGVGAGAGSLFLKEEQRGGSEEASTYSSAGSVTGGDISGASSLENARKVKINKKLQKERVKKKAEGDAIAAQKKCLKHNKALKKLVGEYVTAERRSLETLDDGSAEYKAWVASFNKVGLGATQCIFNNLYCIVLYCIVAVIACDND